MSLRIAMIGSGSIGFSMGVAKELVHSSLMKDSTFVLVDIDAQKLEQSVARINRLVHEEQGTIHLEATTDRRVALQGADFVVTAFAPNRVDCWIKDIEIAKKHGVELLTGENGGPAGQIHALRNITIMRDIAKDMEALCPSAWLMNFTNPMSMLCTYLYKHTTIKSIGFCHQVHGSFGVVAEMMGMEPGDLQVITGGINHMNFLMDIRQKGTGDSYLENFYEQVRQSPYWKKIQRFVPDQRFTLDFLETFGCYPVGYDNHICEYMPFFYSANKCKALGYPSVINDLVELREIEKQQADGIPKSVKSTLDEVEIERRIAKDKVPFPKDTADPYYKETPVAVMEALLTNKPLYLDAMVTTNHGAISNLPSDAVVDVPVVIAGGAVRSVHVGKLPFFAAELCRRQIAIHELVVEAAVTSCRQRLLEAFCLDPYIHDIDTAKALLADYLDENSEYIPELH